MSYYYAVLQSSLAAGLSDVAVNAGVFARPDSDITQTTIEIVLDEEPIEYQRGEAIRGEIK